MIKLLQLNIPSILEDVLSFSLDVNEFSFKFV